MEDSIRITKDEVWRRLKHGEEIVFLDVRNPEAWAAADREIPGSLRILGSEIAFRLDEIPPGRPVVTYCTCPAEKSSTAAAEKLIAHGRRDVHSLKGGYREWERAGFPTTEKRPLARHTA